MRSAPRVWGCRRFFGVFNGHQDISFTSAVSLSCLLHLLAVSTSYSLSSPLTLPCLSPTPSLPSSTNPQPSNSSPVQTRRISIVAKKIHVIIINYNQRDRWGWGGSPPVSLIKIDYNLRFFAIMLLIFPKILKKLPLGSPGFYPIW